MTSRQTKAEEAAWWSRWAAGNAQFALHLARREKERALSSAQESPTPRKAKGSQVPGRT